VPEIAGPIEHPNTHAPIIDAGCHTERSTRFGRPGRHERGADCW
jgi:hypothetical protein